MVITDRQYDTYLMSMIQGDISLPKRAANDEGHVEDHAKIAEAINNLALHPTSTLTKTADNRWMDETGATMYNEEVEAFYFMSVSYMALIVPEALATQDAFNNCPEGTKISIAVRGNYGLISQLGDLRMSISRLESRVAELESPTTNPE